MKDVAVVDRQGLLVIRDDMALRGKIGRCREAEIHGYVEGELDAGVLRVLPSGRFVGTARVGSADVQGELQGDIRVSELMTIRSTGSVTGNVRYGQLAMEAGAKLSANVRNIPPELGGDLDLSVGRGQSVRVALEDLTAYDPDDNAESLVFSVTHVANGSLVMVARPDRGISSFTQADLESGRVAFMHDGSPGNRASFDVVVRDMQGATSGEARTVSVTVV